MKKHFLLASALLVFAACNKPAERTAVVNKDIASKVFAINDIPEITSTSKKAVVYSGSKNADVLRWDDKLKQVKMEGKVDTILKKITSELPKEDMEKHLKTGVVAMVVLKDQIKVFKMMADPAAQPVQPNQKESANGDKDSKTSAANAEMPNEESASPDATAAAAPAQELLTMNYLKKLKEHSKAADARAQAAMEGELAQAKAQRPSQVGDAFGFVEIASIKVEKFGILDNERTDYGEKKSILNVIESSFEMATHVIVGDEIKAKSTDGSDEEASNEQASE